MEKKLVVCNTYFQLIVAIQLVETIWKKDNVEIKKESRRSTSHLIANSYG